METSTSTDGSYEYEVIGEHLVDSRRLLTIDADGRLFDLDLATGNASPTELTDAWVVDTVAARRLTARHDDVVLPPPVVIVG